MIALAALLAFHDGTQIALVPLGTVPEDMISAAKSSIKATLANVEIVIEPRSALPKAAYYPPRDRYRADKIINEAEMWFTDCDKVVCLTSRDISTTNGKVKDWGVLGLGHLGRRACVVSTFRMAARGATKQKARIRFGRVVVHELGHTIGLDHCLDPTCIMSDAKGSIKTVDAAKTFCPSCFSRIKKFAGR